MHERDKPHHCGLVMREVWRADTESGTPEFRGWYCSDCQEFDPAIGRERRWTFHENRLHRVNGG